jgi:predicted aldo/keto reductase-like oxidoreductase
MTKNYMQYRKFGKLNWQVSTLGLGLAGIARLEEETAVKVIRTAIDSGINFIDAGWPPGKNNNERQFSSLNNALKGGYRKKVKIAVTLPSTTINTASDFDRKLEEILKWLHADSMDFLMLGSLNRFTWPRMQNLDILNSLDEALADKKIAYAGFSFHDQYQFLRDVIQAYYKWAFCRFQYSFMDIDHHPGYGGIKFAADSGLAVVAAHPLMAGQLVKNIPETVSSVWTNAKPKRSPAEWALRWVWNHPEIAAVVCDMNSEAQVKENAALADTALPDSFGVPEELVMGKARDAYFALKPIPCTACRGCMPSQGLCPQGIDVPRVFEIYNDAHMYGDTSTARSIFKSEHHDLDACNECGVCVCGKKIPIPDWLKKANTLLA